MKRKLPPKINLTESKDSLVKQRLEIARLIMYSCNLNEPQTKKALYEESQKK